MQQVRINLTVAEPDTWSEAMSGEYQKQWEQAAQAEYDSLMENNTWTLCELPKDRKAIGNKWVFKVKYRSDGSIEKFKARLVAKGYSQQEGIDYNETFAPVAKFNSIRTLMALIAIYGMDLHQMDVVTAFLNGKLKEEIYMLQPEGFTKGKNMVCRLNNTLYGLKQSGREWYLEIHIELIKQGFTRSQADFSIYILNGGEVIIALYVDDLLIASKDVSKINKVKEDLAKKFKMKDLGEAHYCLGIEVMRDKAKACVTLSQRRYIDTILKRFQMEDCKAVSTPMDPGVKLSKDMSPQTDEEIQEMANIPYQKAIGSIMYLMTGTRPDLAYSVGVVSQFMANPGIQHWKALKRIFRYIQSTKDLCLTYQKTDKDYLYGYSDADYAGCIDTSRSTSGYAFMLGEAAITWSSKKQQTVAQSTSEAEYMGMASACREATWLRALLQDTGI